MKIIQDATWIIYLVTCDNLICNQNMFSMFHKKYDSASTYFVQHQIANGKCNELFFFKGSFHLLKNIWNNWCTKKTKQLRCVDAWTGKNTITAWQDFISVYSKELEYVVKQTPVSFAVHYTKYLEKLKVTLALHVFDEITIATLNLKSSVKMWMW